MLGLAERVKRYEAATSGCLPLNTPVIMRVDGRAFHAFTRQFERPFDENFASMMNTVGGALCKEITNARVAYLQSDEISILIYNHIGSDVWFGNNIQKMDSIAASLASSSATQWMYEQGVPSRNITFDSRVFVVPEKDVVNYFLWRQRDWERNSLQMVCHKHYSQSDMQGKNTAQMHEMLFKKGINWNKLEEKWKRGRCIIKIPTPEMPERFKWAIDNFIPIFKQDRNYIESRMTEANEVR